MNHFRAAARGLVAVAVVVGVALGGCAGPQLVAPDAPDIEAARRIGNLEVRGLPEIPASLVERLEQYQNTQQLHRVSQPCGVRRQLTFFGEPVAAALSPPAGAQDGFVCLSDRGGSEFFQLSWFDLASGALLDWVAVQPDLDASRAVVGGGSYGGYMVLAALVHYADRLAAGVNRVGISNFVTFLTNTEDDRRELRRAEYGDERDPVMRAFLERISPLNNVERMQRPLLVLQGANDPRVPASESEQVYRALRGRDVPVWYVLALDEGHGFRKKPNVDYASAATVLFLERFALDE